MIKFNGIPVKFSHFNDGTCRFSFEVPYNISNVVWLYDNDEEIVQLYYLISHLRAHHSKVRLTVPYFPNARQDRAPTDNDVFTLKYFCNLINSLDISEVSIFDPHSDVTPALINNVHIIPVGIVIADLLYNKLPQDTLICYPDAGAEKKYRKLINLPYISCAKERDFATGTIRNLKVVGDKHMIAGHNILVVDDICGKGTTIYYVAKQLKDLGAENVYVYVSHCENTVLKTTDSLLDIPNLITTLYTTNSIYRGEHPKIKMACEF